MKKLQENASAAANTIVHTMTSWMARVRGDSFKIINKALKVQMFLNLFKERMRRISSMIFSLGNPVLCSFSLFQKLP